MLWISAKQLANGKKSAKLTKEGSSQIAKTWLQSHRNPITCDGKAYIQFCVTIPGEGDEGELTLSKSGFVSVR